MRASKAWRRQGKRPVSGGAKSIDIAFEKSSGSHTHAPRSGYRRLWEIAKVIDGGERCASTEPSTNCTMECTRLCLCTTTWILSGSTPKSLRSITSSPLFARVDESIVTLGPIFQLGCLRACSGVMESICSRV